jgi:hypothetical protein
MLSFLLKFTKDKVITNIKKKKDKVITTNMPFQKKELQPICKTNSVKKVLKKNQYVKFLITSKNSVKIKLDEKYHY